jgi:hypothetical protein
MLLWVYLEEHVGVGEALGGNISVKVFQIQKNVITVLNVNLLVFIHS